MKIQKRYPFGTHFNSQLGLSSHAYLQPLMMFESVGIHVDRGNLQGHLTDVIRHSGGPPDLPLADELLPQGT
jgi:hypothetical protein